MCPMPVLPPPDPEVIRSISRRFKMHTCTPDGMHPRHYSLLSSGALEALSLIFHIMDVLGTAPTSIQMIIMLLIPKPQGGRIPLGHYPAMPRLHAKLHRGP
eukprot:8274275-Pyramimonas_sp.AAC.1